jgi:hypothetical protein
MKRDPKTDFAVLYANCHRMIHRFCSPWDLEGFRKSLQSEDAGNGQPGASSVSETTEIKKRTAFWMESGEMLQLYFSACLMSSLSESNSRSEPCSV